MMTGENSNTKKQLTMLALPGLLLLVLFAAGFAWFYYYVSVLGHGNEDVLLAFKRFWIYPYLAVMSLYVGFFAAKFAKGRRKHVWLYAITGLALTPILILTFPGLLSHAFPYQGLVIFGGPAIFAFLAPILSALLTTLLVTTRSKPAA